MLVLIAPILLLQALPADASTSTVPEQSAKPTPAPEPVEPDIVVNARRDGPPRVFPTVADYLRRLCFDPARLSRNFAPPDNDPHWQPLDESLRTKFGAADPSVAAFRLDDPGRNQVLIVRFESQQRADGMVIHQCVFAVMGQIDGNNLKRGVSEILRTPPTQKHVGHSAGTPALPNWHQWLWTGMPNRRSKAWQGYRSSPHAPPSFIVVIDPAKFFDENDYIFCDLKIRNDSNVALLTFGFVTDPS
ncbi:MAG: hypothetical protein K2X31_07990 [Sphingopyxis sp.]|nr:hypothetical protein [Sphingopyxis sp.]